MGRTPTSIPMNDSISFLPSTPRQRRRVLQPHILLSRAHEKLFVPTLKKEDEKDEPMRNRSFRLRHRSNEFSPMVSNFFVSPLKEECLVPPLPSPERIQK